MTTTKRLFLSCVFLTALTFGVLVMIPISVAVSITNGGLLTITDGTTWFTGRNGQSVSIVGVSSGGFDSRGSYYFKQLTTTTAQLYLDAAFTIAPTDLPSGTTQVTIQGFASTLYRSKASNPFAWGFTEVIGTALVPQGYAILVAAGQATAIAISANNSLLKLDFQYPSACYSFNLGLSGSDNFEQSKRVVSLRHSVTSHWSQFYATTQQGDLILWGYDANNFCILQSDAIAQVPISGPIFNQLRSLASVASVLPYHGVYDAQTELNCLWVQTANSTVSSSNWLIYQHAPTGYWGVSNEQDLSASGTVIDTQTQAARTYGGTSTGFFGQILKSRTTGDWNNNNVLLYDSVATGILGVERWTSTSVMILNNPSGLSLHIDTNSWLLLSDSAKTIFQWARVLTAAQNGLGYGYEVTFDKFYNALTGESALVLSIPSGVSNNHYFTNPTECRLQKWFDLGTPAADKQTQEVWATASNVNTADNFFARYYRELSTTPLSIFDLTLDSQAANTYYQKTTVPARHVKSFGIEFVEHGFQPFQILNATIIPQVNE
jgi:hypothetical protein